MSRVRALLRACALLAVPLASAHGEPARAIAIAGHIVGAPRAHSVEVALWDAEGFLKHPVKTVRFAAGHEARYTFTVPPGRWALSAYEDRNENGVLDLGLFGPKEPSGFWRPFGGWHKPRFDEVAVQVERDVTSADITLE
jgi:uncharacterized protein (DUF2141 family)